MTSPVANGFSGGHAAESEISEILSKESSYLLHNSKDPDAYASISNDHGIPDRQEDQPSRSMWSLLANGSQQFAIEFAFGCETALGSPLLLELGIDQSLYGICWLLGPLIGCFLGPILGSFSDNCRARWGRRRPFVLALSLLTVIGSACYLNAPYLAAVSRIGSLTLAIMGIVIVDLNALLSESLSRAYLLDVCNTHDTNKGLLIRAVAGGLGIGFSYAVVGVDWGNTFIGRALGGSYPVIFLATVLVYIVCVLVSITSIPETPLATGLGEDMELIPAASSGDLSATRKKVEVSGPTVHDRLKSVIFMPNRLRILCTAHYFGWAAFTTIVLYFTDYYAVTIMHGDAHAPRNSTAYQDYEEGIRMGSWGLCVFGMSSAILSVLYIKMARFVRLKTQYIACPLIYSLCLGAMAFLTDFPYATIALCSGVALIYSNIATLPFDILSCYHSDNEFTHPENGHVRGQGTDVGILFAMAFFAIMTVSIIMGPLVVATSSQVTVVVTSAIFAFAAACCACFVTDQTRP